MVVAWTFAQPRGAADPQSSVAAEQTAPALATLSITYHFSGFRGAGGWRPCGLARPGSLLQPGGQLAVHVALVRTPSQRGPLRSTGGPRGTGLPSERMEMFEP